MTLPFRPDEAVVGRTPSSWGLSGDDPWSRSSSP